MNMNNAKYDQIFSLLKRHEIKARIWLKDTLQSLEPILLYAKIELFLFLFYLYLYFSKYHLNFTDSMY